MTDHAERDTLEIERQRDAFHRLDRINGVERDQAVLKTRFDANEVANGIRFEAFIKELARSVSADDLKILRRELLDKIKEEVGNMHIEIERSNQAWAEKILTGAKLLNAESQMQRMEEQRRFRQQLLLAIFGATLSIIAALVIIWVQTGRP